MKKMQDLHSFRKWFDPYLVAVLTTRMNASRIHTRDKDVQALVAYAGTIASAGGKRVRPYLAWIMYQAFGGKKNRTILDILAALEIFHVFCLIHDDIIDHGMARHGIPTTHIAVAKRLTKQKRHGDLGHIAEGQAMLLGDLLFSWVTHLFRTLPSHTATPPRAASLFYRMVDEVVIGQMLDVDLMTRNVATTQLVDEKMRLKTANYTFVRPMQIGAALAVVPRTMDRFCETFGTAIGLAFQIQDDLFDLTIPTTQVGKTIFSDLTNRQHTLFTQHILEQGNEKHRKQLRALFGATLLEKDRPRITKLFTDSGAIAYGYAVMDAHFADATRAVENARLPTQTKQQLHRLILALRHRTS
jgi:geranylgeranyl diphosphate synthase type I